MTFEAAHGRAGAPDAADKPRVAAILLAAGVSERMGESNKLLLDFAGQPMIRRVAGTLLASRLARVVVVLGHQAEVVRAALHDLPLDVVVNRDFAEGQQSSVRAGLDALGGGCDGVLIALGDQPFLAPGDVDALIDAFARSARERIVVPYRQGVRGNPVVLPAAAIDDIRASGRNLACRQFVDRNPDRVTRYETGSDGYFHDIDEPAEFAAALAKAGCSSSDVRSSEGSQSHETER